MEQKDDFVGLIAFLFEKDHKDHPPPGDLLARILQKAQSELPQSNQD